MSQKLNLKNWIKAFDNGEFDSKDIEIQIKAGWHDWFCNSSSLYGKTKRLAPKVKQITKSPKINPNNYCVWFKNNCSVYGKLYDDFRLADIKTGDTQYVIIPKSGHDIYKGEAQVYSREHGFREPVAKGTWKDVCKFFEV